MNRPARMPLPPGADQLDIRSIASLLWRRKWILIIPIVVCAIVGYVLGRPEVIKPIYRCSSTLMLEYPQSLSGDLAHIVPTTSMGEQLARLQNQIQSESFLKKVIISTGMDEDPSVRDWASRNRNRYPDLTEDELADLRLMKLLREMIRMTSPRANVFQITVQDHIPERARLIATTLTRAVIEAKESSRMDLLRATHEFSLEQLALYKQKLSESERRLEAVRRNQGGRNTRPNLVDNSNKDIAWSLRENAITQRSTAVLAFDAISDSLAPTEPRLKTIFLGLQNATWMTDAVSGLKNLEKRYIEQTLRPTTDGEDPQSVAIRQARTLEDLREDADRMLSQVYPELDKDLRDVLATILLLDINRRLTVFRVDHLDLLLDAHQGRIRRQPELALEIRRLEEETETNQTLYNAFVQQIATAEISEAFESTKVGGKITILEPPQRPLKPVRPNRRALFLLAILVGTAAGLGGIFFLEQHDPSLRDIRQVEEATGLKVLGTIPAMKELHRFLRKRENGAMSETTLEELSHFFLNDNQAYHECRKVFLDIARENHGKGCTILITSARAGEGKTTASSFLAMTMAREVPQARIILVDLDARRPSLHRYFGYDPKSPGVRQILGDAQDPETVLRSTWLPNIKILPIGSEEGGKYSSLSAEEIRSLLALLRPMADYIVLDTPPNLPIPDALVAGQEVDAVLVVVKAGETPRRVVQRGVEIQLQFSENVRGILLNNVSDTLPFYDDYRYYGYGFEKKKS